MARHLAFGIALLALVVVIAGSHRSANSLVVDREWVAHTEEALTKIEASRPGIRVLYTSGYTGEALSDCGLAPKSESLAKPHGPSDRGRKVRQVLHAVEQRA